MSIESIAVSWVTSSENPIRASYFLIRLANSPPPITNRQLWPSSAFASSIAFFGNKLPPILITHSIIVSQLNDE